MWKAMIIDEMIKGKSEIMGEVEAEHGAAHIFYSSWRNFREILPDRNYKLVTPASLKNFQIRYSQFLDEYSLPRDLRGTQQSDFDRLTITAADSKGDKVVVCFRAPEEVVDLATVRDIVGKHWRSHGRRLGRLIIVLHDVKLTKEDLLLIHNASPAKLEFFHITEVVGGWIKRGTTYEMGTAEEKKELFMTNFQFMCTRLCSLRSRYYGLEEGELVKWICPAASGSCPLGLKGTRKVETKKRKKNDVVLKLIT